MDIGGAVVIPQLSNEMQLYLMNKVKHGELSIEDVYRQGMLELYLQEVKDASQHNFSVHKFNRYRWQKRVLQLDFGMKVLCSIEKGIMKRQLQFASVKNCHDGAGTKLSISFQGHDDYELEATSQQEKQKILQLLNSVIYSNIYSPPDIPEKMYETLDQEPRSLRHGHLLLQNGGMASFKWKKYEAELLRGQLTLLPLGNQLPGDAHTSPSLAVMVHFSDGRTTVEKSGTFDAFTLVTHHGEYQLRVPMTDELSSSEAVQKERDAWVGAIHQLCRDSAPETLYEEPRILRARKVTARAYRSRLPAPNEPRENGERRSSRGSSDEERLLPSARRLSAPSVPPLPKPRRLSHSSPTNSIISPSPTAPVPAFSPPPLAPVPAPPPLPKPATSRPQAERTKAFHWDRVAPEKVDKSFWTLGVTGKVEIDTSRLFEQFRVKDPGSAGDAPAPSHQVEIMLNQKVAHNFNIFLRSFPLQPGLLKEKLSVINEEDGGLTDEHIASLRRYVPTSDDVEMYKSYKGPVSELHIVDQYMLELCNIPYLSSRLDLLLTLRELPSTIQDLEPLIGQKIRMCQQLIGSRGFVSVLEYLLVMGNYLNENAGKEKVKGFRLSSLPKAPPSAPPASRLWWNNETGQRGETES
ncbi:delphilin isoform X2 [Denticeps clupeoides]|uniref:delphilin isoform X2 n=1 Tax=Denticeps clupeoides TaxID=299321 RepID=UPI0010A449AA|nr:delphilin-like isoform X2 [Denticeps clupeoides]